MIQERKQILEQKRKELNSLYKEYTETVVAFEAYELEKREKNEKIQRLKDDINRYKTNAKKSQNQIDELNKIIGNSMIKTYSQELSNKICSLFPTINLKLTYELNNFDGNAWSQPNMFDQRLVCFDLDYNKYLIIVSGQFIVTVTQWDTNYIHTFSPNQFDQNGNRSSLYITSTTMPTGQIGVKIHESFSIADNSLQIIPTDYLIKNDNSTTNWWQSLGFNLNNMITSPMDNTVTFKKVFVWDFV